MRPDAYRCKVGSCTLRPMLVRDPTIGFLRAYVCMTHNPLPPEVWATYPRTNKRSVRPRL